MSKGNASSVGEPKRHREASEWFVEHESGQEPTAEACERWNTWASDANNRAEYAQMARLDRDMDRLSRPRASTDREILEDSFEVPAVRTHSPGAGGLGERMRAQWEGHRFAAAAVGLGVFATTIGLLATAWLNAPFGSPPTVEHSYRTGPGEQRQLALADGSQITLGGGTVIRVRFSEKTRLVVLSSGEGLFRVQHDKTRPFVVCAAEGCTAAVGTVFDVRRYSSHVRVAVQEGTVEVTPFRPMEMGSDALPKGSPGERPLRLSYAQEMSYNNNGDATAVRSADPRISAAWVTGSLIYHARPLTDVIEDVQRYFDRPLMLDPAAADLQFSGSVMQTNIEQWIQGLPEVFPVETIDCREIQSQSVAACASHPERILIRTRTSR